MATSSEKQKIKLCSFRNVKVIPIYEYVLLNSVFRVGEEMCHTPSFDRSRTIRRDRFDVRRLGLG